MNVRWSALLVAVALVVGGVVAGAQPAVAADQITGAGSTWSQIAVDQWRSDVAREGLSVNYQGQGSTTGRQFYIQGTADFAVSEIPFQGPTVNREGQTQPGETENAARRPYAYLPIVAGGTSFMYHLDVNGRRVTDLQLSGRTIARIFTGQITNWNDPAITEDNGGRALPSLPVVPVLRSDGSGTSAQFTAYMADMHGDVWNPFCSSKLNLPSPCPAQSLYPYFPPISKSQQGSDGVANFVAAPYNNGTITYVEYGYALQRGFPVASVLNQAGYYTQPTAENVAIALTKARINPDRTQVLGDVYRNPDARTYPVSSYSYMIVPTTTDAPFTAGKGETLGRFILYFLCTGQQKAKQLGYSPLPPNLVEFGFEAVTKIPGAPAPPALDKCANPTITGQFNLANAPAPPASAKKGAARSGGGGSGGSRSASGGSGAVTASDLAASTDTTVAGEVATEGDASFETDAQLAAARAQVPVSVSQAHDDVPMAIYFAIVLMVLLIAFAPPAVAVALRRRDQQRPSPGNQPAPGGN